jgi:hypothetical protein
MHIHANLAVSSMCGYSGYTYATTHMSFRSLNQWNRDRLQVGLSRRRTAGSVFKQEQKRNA